MFLLQLVYYGDIVIPTPAWVSYAPQANIIGRKVVFVPTSESDGWRLTAEKLEELCNEDRGRPRILVLNYPSNPTGRTYENGELKAIARVARKHRVVVLSDEIYGRLHHEGKHESIAKLYPEGTILSTGLSKWCGAGGWRLGVFIFPRKMRWMLDAISSVASETYTSTSAPIQYAAVRAFQGGEEIETYLKNARRVLKVLGANLAERLRKADVSVLQPEGAFYLFPSFEAHRERLEKRGIRTSREFCEQLLQDTGVAMLPGEQFGRPDSELNARLAYVDFDGAAALKAVTELEGEPGTPFLDQRCGTLLHAVERIADWLRK